MIRLVLCVVFLMATIAYGSNTCFFIRKSATTYEELNCYTTYGTVSAGYNNCPRYVQCPDGYSTSKFIKFSANCDNEVGFCCDDSAYVYQDYMQQFKAACAGHGGDLTSTIFPLP